METYWWSTSSCWSSLMNLIDHVWLPFHGVHCGQNILIGWEGDKEGKGNQPETYCEICHHLKNEFRDDKNRTADATWKQGQGIITHFTEWIIILSKVWKGEIVVHQDLRIRFGNGFLLFKRRPIFTIITDRINDAEETEKKGNEERRARWATCKDLSSIYHQPRNVEAANP